MHIADLISEIRKHLEDSFASVDRWFDEPEATRNFRPEPGRWTISEVLEHIALTNHFLLILIEKGKQKALNKVAEEDLQAALQDYVFHRDRLDEVGIHRSFEWIRPEHMEPSGKKSPEELRSLLREQEQQCLAALEKLKNGEGVLYKTTMTVNKLGKIDVYEYIYFLSQHSLRHISQMEKNRRAFLDKKS